MNLQEEDCILLNLDQCFGHRSLRPGQLPIIQNVLKGKDVLVCKESGFGKSLCYQIGGIMKEGVIIVISPFPSRMEDKCCQLSSLHIKCAFLNTNADDEQPDKDLRSILTANNRVLEELRHFETSELKFLYTSLKYFISSNRLKQILGYLYEQDLLQAFVFDEASHIIECYSHLAFRGDVHDLNNLQSSYPNVPLLCFTSPTDVRNLSKIRDTLRLRSPYVFNEPCVRGNVLFKVMYTEEKVSFTTLAEYVKSVYTARSGIIFCHTQEDCQSIVVALHKIAVPSIHYRCALTPDEKAWLKWRSLHGIVVVCVSGSNADIPLPNVNFIIHTNMPRSLDIYHQETQRAGKNVDHGDCILFYSNKDYDFNLKILNQQFEEGLKQINMDAKKCLEYKAEVKRRRRAILDFVVYAENTSVCRQAFLLSHLDEGNFVPRCGICDICQIMKDQFSIDVSLNLRKILMAIWTINRRQKTSAGSREFFHATIDEFVGLLLGNVRRCMMDSWVTKEWFFGIFGSWDLQVLYRFIFILLSNRFILVNLVSNEDLEVTQNLVITLKGQNFIKSNTEFSITLSQKELLFTKWLNTEWVQSQFQNDLESVLSYHSLHNKQHIFDWHNAYASDLFQYVPKTWEEFKNIKHEYMTSEKSDLDEDLFIICLTYHRILKRLNHDRESTDGNTPPRTENPAVHPGMSGKF